MPRRLGPLLLVLLLGWAGVAAPAQDADTSRFWTDLPDPAAPPGRTLRLDVARLQRHLRGVPLESAQVAPALLALPLPGGGFGRFDVVESPILEPALQGARQPRVPL